MIHSVFFLHSTRVSIRNERLIFISNHFTTSKAANNDREARKKALQEKKEKALKERKERLEALKRKRDSIRNNK